MYSYRVSLISVRIFTVWVLAHYQWYWLLFVEKLDFMKNLQRVKRVQNKAF